MKRLLIVCLLSSPAYGITLKEINNSRPASAVKAVVAALMAGCSAVNCYRNLQELYGRPPTGFNRKLLEHDLYHATGALGMGYTAEFLVKYAWYHARYALDGTK